MHQCANIFTLHGYGFQPFKVCTANEFLVCKMMDHQGVCSVKLVFLELKCGVASCELRAALRSYLHLMAKRLRRPFIGLYLDGKLSRLAGYEILTVRNVASSQRRA